MKRLLTPTWPMVALLAALTLHARPPAAARAESPVKLQKWGGMIDTFAEQALPFILQGEASHLGLFTAYGEVDFLPGVEPGSLVGVGAVVFKAANGDQLVGVAAWQVNAAVDGIASAQIHFSWRDFVEFSDGSVASSTGRFVDSRPPGLVVPALLIALLRIGMTVLSPP